MKAKVLSSFFNGEISPGFDVMRKPTLDATRNLIIEPFVQWHKDTLDMLQGKIGIFLSCNENPTNLEKDSKGGDYSTNIISTSTNTNTRSELRKREYKLVFP